MLYLDEILNNEFDYKKNIEYEFKQIKAELEIIQILYHIHFSALSSRQFFLEILGNYDIILLNCCDISAIFVFTLRGVTHGELPFFIG